MRARAVAMAALASVSIVGIGWQLGTQAIDASQSLTTSSGAGASTAVTTATDAAAQAAATAKAAADAAAAAQAQADAANTAASAQAAADAAVAATTAAQAAAAADTAAAAASATAASSAQSGTFTGSVVATQFGNMQVSVTIANGVITDVTPLQLTNRGGRSVAISNQAAPILRSEVISAQSTSVQNVSGATYTTGGYLQSLQSALDAAGF